MIFLPYILTYILTFMTSFNLTADTSYSPSSYAAPANPAQSTTVNTGYVLVPESQLKDIYGPKQPAVNLKDLTDKALSLKTDALGARSEIGSGLTTYTKAVNNLKDAENVHKAAEQLVSDRKKTVDDASAKLTVSIKKAQDASQKVKDAAKKLHDGKKSAKKPSDATDAERVATLTSDVATSLDTAISQANAELTKTKN